MKTDDLAINSVKYKVTKQFANRRDTARKLVAGKNRGNKDDRRAIGNSEVLWS